MSELTSHPSATLNSSLIAQQAQRKKKDQSYHTAICRNREHVCECADSLSCWINYVLGDASGTNTAQVTQFVSINRWLPFKRYEFLINWCVVRDIWEILHYYSTVFGNNSVMTVQPRLLRERRDFWGANMALRFLTTAGDPRRIWGSGSWRAPTLIARVNLQFWEGTPCRECICARVLLHGRWSAHHVLLYITHLLSISTMSTFDSMNTASRIRGASTAICWRAKVTIIWWFDRPEKELDGCCFFWHSGRMRGFHRRSAVQEAPCPVTATDLRRSSRF